MVFQNDGHLQNCSVSAFRRRQISRRHQRSVQDFWPDIIGIQRDGSLWSFKKAGSANLAAGKTGRVTKHQLARFDDGNDWKNISGRFIIPLLLKTDDTLWFGAPDGWKWNKPWHVGCTPSRRNGREQIRRGQIFTDNGRTFFIKTRRQSGSEPGNGADEVNTLGHASRQPRHSSRNNKLEGVRILGQVRWAPFQLGIFETVER